MARVKNLKIPYQSGMNGKFGVRNANGGFALTTNTCLYFADTPYSCPKPTTLVVLMYI